MNFDSPLYRASLIERYATVLADVCLENGEAVTAYCSNTTRMKTLAVPGAEVFLSFNRKEGRRLLYTWETVSANGTLVGVNETRRYDITAEGIANGVLSELAGYREIRRILPSRGGSTVDMVLIPQDDRFPVCRAAIVTAYLKKGVDLLFPDGIYVWNRKVLDELGAALDAGERAVLIVLAQRIDCIGVRADWTADAQYVTSLKEFCDKGLEILCYGCTVSSQGIWASARLPFMF